MNNKYIPVLVLLIGLVGGIIIGRYSWSPAAMTPLPTAVADGVQWLGTPQEMKDKPLLFKDQPKEAMFYLLGSVGDDQIIASLDWDCSLGGCNVYMFRKTGSVYWYLSRHSTFLYHDIREGSASGVMLASTVQDDPTTAYPTLSIPETLTYKGVTLSALTSYGLYDEGTRQRLGAVESGELYLSNTSYISAHTNEIMYSLVYLKLPSGLYVQYIAESPVVRDDGSLTVTFNDGFTTADLYSHGNIGGCGGSGPAAISEPVSSRITVIGKTQSGESIYGFVQSDDPVVRTYYELMSDQDENGIREYYVYDRVTNQSTMHEITLTEYLKRHAIFLYHDPFGRWLVYTDSTYGLQAECGKPVIYLYPEKPTQVSVRVGADVRVSEPEYNGGWNVMAEPTGKQTLFWEGMGWGMYPAITEGFIVKQADLEPTLRTHLAQQGLNTREAQDFMDFWWPKMPTAPYVRLTWLSIEQMNTLAPLYVSPRPDTMKRVFLDFEGLQKPISLPEQKLSATPRKGFFLMEWGGLLRK